AETKAVLYADTLNGAGGRLEGERSGLKSCQVRGVGSRPSSGDFAGVAGSKVIYESGRENVRFVDESILRNYGKCGVRVSDELEGIEHGSLGKPVIFVAAG